MHSHTLSIMDPAHRFKPWERARFIEARGMVCAYCATTGDRWHTEDGKPWQVDHVVPPSRGGAGRDWANLALSCAVCNDLKSNRLLEELPEFFAALRLVATYARFADHMDRMLEHITAGAR